MNNPALMLATLGAKMSKVEQPKVYFSREQYEYLNKVFCESTGKPKEHHEYAFKDGQRTVVKFIEHLVRQ